MSVARIERPTRRVESAPRAHLAAVATRDPFDPRTFSGYSASLFSALQRRGLAVSPMTSKQIRVRDLLGGAVNLGGIARGRFRGRRAPLVAPDWYFSDATLERLSERIDAQVRAAGGITHVLQVGTHVCIDLPGVRSFCVTDCTVPQSIAAGEFAVSHASPDGVRRAIAWQRRVFDACEVVFTTSRWAAASVVRDCHQSPERVIDVGAGATNATAPRAPRIDGPPTVLFVGYDWNLKGGPLLVEAWRAVRRSVPDVRLRIIGCAPRIPDAGVEVLGRLDPAVPEDRRRLVDAYSSATCLALVSDFDAFPNVVLEAGAMGVPVVAFDEQSRSEVVVHCETGILVDSHDADAVAEALTMLVSDRIAARAMGMRAHRRITSMFTWERVAARVATVMGCADA